MIHTTSLQGDDISSRLSRRMDSVSLEAKVLTKHHTAMFLDGTDEAKAEPGTKSSATGPRFPSFTEWKKDNTARISAVLEEHINGIAFTGAKSDVHDDGRAAKRKAKRQMPISSVINVTSSNSTWFTLDELDDKGTPELTAKRQRIWQNEAIQSEFSDTMDPMTDEIDAPVDAWTDKHMDGT
ncbi:hypothetical protein P171DRAFT_216725 [Karstenula rhodostoma CBS 690.94]|uniref:Uncharacterized protein n=1 Tax=Karstenula rhodostoma CBS 690.94 TaxID=1392251 RepID=A0A9P4UFK4_9PLEO|nr:hypothetical protein P171DRAFT_216725 [Karstenula rhodostoma CBS 690.94]